MSYGRTIFFSHYLNICLVIQTEGYPLKVVAFYYYEKVYAFLNTSLNKELIYCCLFNFSFKLVYAIMKILGRRGILIDR